MGVRKWVGNEKDGYCIFKSKRKNQSWTGQTWSNGRVNGRVITEVVGKTQKEAVARLKKYKNIKAHLSK